MRRFALAATLFTTLLPVSMVAQPALPVVRYTVGTGSLDGIPLISGKTYEIVVDGLNPLCYSYTAEISVKEDKPDLSRLIAAFGSLPGAAAATASTPSVTEATDSAKPGVGNLESGSDDMLETARDEVLDAQQVLLSLRQATLVVEGVVKEVITPACARNGSFVSIKSKWDATATQRAAVVGGATRLTSARRRLSRANASLASVPRSAAKTVVATQVAAVTAEADSLAAKLATVLRDLYLAQGALAAAEGQQQFHTQVFLPAGTSAVDLTVRATELRPGDGKTAATVEQKASISVRKGMRVFLSVGYLASTANTHDYERANRPCPQGATFECESIYSTYVNRSPGGGFAFSPVLQVNVAFRDVLRSGASFHTSAGVAARSVNGTVSPEFILGAGTGLLDRLLLTAGVHLARDEKLLLGSPAEVERAPVSDKVTPSDAISEIWRVGVVATVTVRLN
jgi:hypothetical protein